MVTPALLEPRTLFRLRWLHLLPPLCSLAITATSTQAATRLPAAFIALNATLPPRVGHGEVGHILLRGEPNQREPQRYTIPVASIPSTPFTPDTNSFQDARCSSSDLAPAVVMR